jgi:CRISPR-associated endonuclease/helicase Cas3
MTRMADSTGLATEILEAHQRAGGRTLVIVNTVKRARDLARQLQRVTKSVESKPELVLIHSRFRLEDRRRRVERLLAEPGEHGMIVISTQVVEAGVDVSATTLHRTRLWAAGSAVCRCNRGNETTRQAFWIDLLPTNHHAKVSARTSPPNEVQSFKPRAAGCRHGVTGSRCRARTSTGKCSASKISSSCSTHTDRRK